MEIMKNTYHKNRKNCESRKSQRPKKKGKKFRDENKPKVKMEIMKNTYHKL